MLVNDNIANFNAFKHPPPPKKKLRRNFLCMATDSISLTLACLVKGGLFWRW